MELDQYPGSESQSLLRLQVTTDVKCGVHFWLQFCAKRGNGDTSSMFRYSQTFSPDYHHYYHNYVFKLLMASGISGFGQEETPHMAGKESQIWQGRNSIYGLFFVITLRQ